MHVGFWLLWWQHHSTCTDSACDRCLRSAEPIADALAALKWPMASPDHLGQINEDVGSAVIRGDETETLVVADQCTTPNSMMPMDFNIASMSKPGGGSRSRAAGAPDALPCG